jgi:hypothetical protein
MENNIFRHEIRKQAKPQEGHFIFKKKLIGNPTGKKKIPHFRRGISCLHITNHQKPPVIACYHGNMTYYYVTKILSKDKTMTISHQATI